MPNKPDEDIRKSITEYQDSLPDSAKNPNVKVDVQKLIQRASQPLSRAPETPPGADGYTETQTRPHKTEDTSD